MTSCEEDDDFALLGDGDGDGDGDDGNDSEAAKAKRRKPGPQSQSQSQSQSHHNSQKKKDSPYSSTLLVPAPVPVPVPVPPKKQHQGGSGSGSGSGDVYRKDREEWSDGAIEALLDAYTHRFELLNRGNLRGRDWEDVAAAVNTTTPTSNKTVEQCKNKIDNLKKRFKVECHRLSSSSTPTSHWPWFSKLHLIVSSSSSNNNNNNNNNNNSSSAAFSASRGGSPIPVSIPIPITNADDDGSPSASASASGTPAPARNSKRYAAAAPAMRVFNVPRCKWKRVLLKVSGAALAGTGTGTDTDTATAPHNVDPKVVMLIAREIQVVSRQGIQVAVVVGGRNIFCGESWIASTAVDRAATYQICMMASVMNAMVLQASLEKIGVATRVQTNLTMQEVAEPYIRRKAISHLDKGRVVIFGGIASGLGNPLFTTDAAAALRASEINADAVLKGTTVDALYSGCHPGSGNNSSPGFEHISYREFVSRGYTPMDTTAVAFCEENNIPVVLFNLLETGNISRAIAGDQIGTLIDQSGQIG